MANLFAPIGIETGDLSEFDSNGAQQSAAVDQKHHGAYALKTTAGYNNASKGVVDASTERWIFFMMRFDRLAVGTEECVFFIQWNVAGAQGNLTYVGDNGIKPQIALYKSAGFEVKWWIDSGDFDPNEWHSFLLRSKDDTGGTDGEIDVYVDGTLRIQATGINNSQPTAYDLGWINDTAEMYSGAFTVWEDCFVVADSIITADPFATGGGGGLATKRSMMGLGSWLPFSKRFPKLTPRVLCRELKK